MTNLIGKQIKIKNTTNYHIIKGQTYLVKDINKTTIENVYEVLISGNFWDGPEHEEVYENEETRIFLSKKQIEL